MLYYLDIWLRYESFLLITLHGLPIDLWLLTSVLFLVPDCLLGLTLYLILDLSVTLRSHDPKSSQKTEALRANKFSRGECVLIKYTCQALTL